LRIIIAEKAIAGRRIASILAGKDVPSTMLGKAQVFNFEDGKDKTMVIPLRGHISDVEFPKQYSYWLGTDLKKLVDADIEYIGKEAAIISALKTAAKDADEVVIATDADREGEAIGVEALNYMKESNPKLKVERAYFSAITPKDIEVAFSKFSKVDYNYADSADSRREIDLIWGAVITRFLSLISGRLGKEFLSAGRVQTPTLAIIVNRENERRAFKSKKYWELNAEFEKESKKFEAQHKEGKFWDEEKVKKAYKKEGKKGKITKVTKKKRVLKKPIPFNTTGFLRAATAIGFTAGEAMNMAESLYQSGYTSYPRTDNSVYSPTLNLKEILNELSKIPEFVPMIEKLLAMPKFEPSKGKESKDHPPIHPVTAAPKTKLSERQWKIYELICRRFFATLWEEAITNNVTVEIDLNSEIYLAHGQVLENAGWKEFYPYSTLKEVHLPEMETGDEVDLVKLSMDGKETQPPTRYSQATLIKLMEDNGLGTKSTRHTIIQKLFVRHYISGLKAIEPNAIAFAVIGALEKYSEDLAKPNMTSKLEKEMDEISGGKKTKKEVVTDSREMLKKNLLELLENKDKIGTDLRKALQSDSILAKCDVCDGELRKIKSKNNKWFLGCTNYPKCTNTYPLPQKGRIISAPELCKACGKGAIKVFGKRYRYEMCIDPNCISKKDWAKKKEEKLQKEKEKKEAEASAAKEKKTKKEATAKKD